MSKINFIEAVVELDSGLQVRLSGEYAPIREFLDKIEKDFDEEEDNEYIVDEKDCTTWPEGMLVRATTDCAGGFSSIKRGDVGEVGRATSLGVWVNFPSNGLSYFIDGEVKAGEIRPS